MAITLLDKLPERPEGAMTGSAFVEDAVTQWERLPGQGGSHFTIQLRAREEAILAEVMAGNVPGFVRTFWEVPLPRAAPAHTASVWVMADYLAIGSDDDFVRIPLSPISATQLADAFGCVLPNKVIVDAIYETPDAKRQTAIPMPPPGPQMTSLQRAKAHNDKIEAARDGELGELLAGHKKDVVVAWRLASTPNAVAIYGFFNAKGAAYQSLQMPHPDWYSDYSHGIRLVRDTMTIDGEDHKIEDVLRDPALCSLLTDPRFDPGPYKVTRYPIRPIPEEVAP